MATWFSGISRYQRTIRKNVFIWCCIYLALFFLLILRLTWLQTVRHAHYFELGEQYRFRQGVLPAPRGRIRDRNFLVLAQDNERLSLFADPTLCAFPWEAGNDTGAGASFDAQQLAPIIARPQEDILASLQHQLSFVWVKRNLSPETADALRRLALPGLEIKEDGFCYRIGIDLAKVPADNDLPTELAETLKLPKEDVRDQLGLDLVPADDQPAKSPRTGQRWVRGVYTGDVKDAIRKMRLPGVIFQQDRQNFSLGADPRPFLDHHYNVEVTANTLAPVLGLKKGDVIQRRLLYRPRFTWLKRDMPNEMLQQYQHLQSTLYLVAPGRVIASPGKDMTPDETVSATVDRIYNLLNERHKDKKTHKYIYNETISRDEIRRRLTSTAPCVIGEKMVDGSPSLPVSRSLFAQPIPGVIYGLPGVSTQQERGRYYPYNTLASPTLGFVAMENDRMCGAFGLEQTEEKTLAGKDGYEEKEIDARRKTIPEQSKLTDPVDGRDVILTLDLNVQQAAEAALAKAVQTTKALGGQCVVMDPYTGDILALVAMPSWDANNPGKSKVPLVNPVVSHFYEPGSTFKVLTVMAALEEKAIHDGETVTICSGPLAVGKRSIREAHSYHGKVDCGRLLEQSCNIGAATLAMKLGPDRFLKWCDRLGFGLPTGIELRNESAGSLNRRNCRQARITLANEGFGQSMAVTPLQMAALYSAVANGGKLVKPHLLKARLLPDGKREEFKYPATRVCSEETARLLRGYLVRVVTKGTGKSAAIPGYSVAGKTGTAQKAGPGGYRSGKAIGSFIGFLPANKPRFTIIAIIDEPSTSHYGGVVATPVFSEVGRCALHQASVPPDQPLADAKGKQGQQGAH